MPVSGTIKADKTISVQDFIALRTSDEITYYNYSILEYLNGFDMFVTNLLYDYDDELQDISVVVTLTDIERANIDISRTCLRMMCMVQQK